MNDTILKQLVFDCAVELLHEAEGLTKEQIANRLLNAIKAHDKGYLKNANTLERLEVIKRDFEFVSNAYDKANMPKMPLLENLGWLISTVEEQADKIEAYENLKQTLEEFNHSQSEKIEEQQEKIEGLNEDLFYEQMQKEMFRKLIVENLKPSNVLLEKENARLRESIENILSLIREEGAEVSFLKRVHEVGNEALEGIK